MGAVIDSTLASYSQVLFSRFRTSGLILMCATAVRPSVFAHGLLAVLISNAVALLIGMNRRAIRTGLFGFNGLLVGLGIGAWFTPSPATVALLLAASIAVVLTNAGMRRLLGETLGLPVLSVPFLIVFYAILAASPSIEALEFQSWLPAATPVATYPWWLVTTFGRCLGAIFFVPEPMAGALVLLALILASRASVFLSLFAFAIVLIAGVPLLSNEASITTLELVMNSVLIGIALGGVFFVLGRTSLLSAIIGIVIGMLVALATCRICRMAGLPGLVLPFNVTVLLFLYAMRHRTRNRAPVQLNVILRSPEESWYRHWERVERFGWSLPKRLSLPFRGTWQVTQGWNATETHNRDWSHGWDFQVFDERGSPFKTQGADVSDYHCFRLPVTAPADGVVVSVNDGVEDNPVGEQNMVQNWGNNISMQHADGLFSLVAHLSLNTITVQEGQRIKRGDEIGLCGNSGRSAIPHLHVQFQASRHAGAPTIPGEFHDTVLECEPSKVLGCYVPIEGDRVRNLMLDMHSLGLFSLPRGRSLSFQVDTPSGSSHVETIRVETNPYQEKLLRSVETGSILKFNDEEPALSSLEFSGSRSSALAAIHMATGQIPMEIKDGAIWNSKIVWHPHRTILSRWLREFSRPLIGSDVRCMAYEMRKHGADLVVTGRSSGIGYSISTEARFSNGHGLADVTVSLGKKQLKVRRLDV